MRSIARIPLLGRFTDRTSGAKEDTDERFARWWSEVEPRVISLGERYLRSTDHARDVAQDVALAAYLNFELFRDSGHFAAWCLKRARWLALDRLRAAGRLSELLTTEASVDTSQETQTWLAEVMDVVETLPTAQREALKLSVEGYDAAEIASRLGVTASTVRSLRRHARLNLLRRLSAVEDVR